jgi:hypothetical protein
MPTMVGVKDAQFNVSKLINNFSENYNEKIPASWNIVGNEVTVKFDVTKLSDKDRELMNFSIIKFCENFNDSKYDELLYLNNILIKENVDIKEQNAKLLADLQKALFDKANVNNVFENIIEYIKKQQELL